MAPSTAQLARMRTQVSSTLPDTCVIKSVSRAVDSAGRVTETLIPVTGGTVNCRMDVKRVKPLVADNGGKVIVALESTVTLPYDAPIAADRYITKDGNNYRVTSLIDGEGYRMDRRLSVELIL